MNDRPNTLARVHLLGLLLLQKGRPAEAELLLRQALAGRAPVLGEATALR